MKEGLPQVSKLALARSLGISRASLYYVSKKDEYDWNLKTKIEMIWREPGCVGYGSRRLAKELNLNRKRIQRVMRKHDIRPYRRRGKKWLKKKKTSVRYPNLLHATIPAYPNHIWASDFTELWIKNQKIYVATVIDLYTREIIGIAVSIRKGTPLVLQALYGALLNHPHPEIFHSDNGREYDAKAFIAVLDELMIRISRSHPGCPWENGYQESFYDKFKVELGDSNRFNSLGELVAEVYRTIWAYNHRRIHSALNMAPKQFAANYLKNIEIRDRVGV